MPDVKLPRYTGGYPEDAAVHVAPGRRAAHAAVRQSAAAACGRPRASVCQAMIPLLAAARHPLDRHRRGDPQPLDAGLRQPRSARATSAIPSTCIGPTRCARASSELGIVFRDHALSDMIGFHYQRSEPAAAAEDFVGHLHGIGQAVDSDEPALVSVILDGENCWEHYPGGGVAVPARALPSAARTTPGVRPVTIGDYLEQHPPRDTLAAPVRRQLDQPQLRHLDRPRGRQHAWDALHRTREHLRSAAEQPASRRAEKLRAGLGGAVHRRGQRLVLVVRRRPFQRQDALFDYLFRKHLQNVYLLLGDAPPPELARPISRSGQRAIHTLAARLPGRQDRRPVHVLRVDQRRPLHLPERARHDGDGDAGAAQRGVLRLRPASAAGPRRLRRPGPRRPGRVTTSCASASWSRPAARCAIAPARASRRSSWQLLHARASRCRRRGRIEVGIDQIVEWRSRSSCSGVTVDRAGAVLRGAAARRPEPRSGAARGDHRPDAAVAAISSRSCGMCNAIAASAHDALDATDDAMQPS